MENTVDLLAGDIYKHFKGDYYKIVCVARDSETTEPLVVYEGQYTSKEWGDKPIWVRPLKDFIDYKIFEDGKKVKRFIKVDKIPEDYTGGSH